MRIVAAAAVTLAAVSLPAGAINVCVNEKGVKSYQDEPCVTKAPSAALSPVKSETLNDRVVRETMKRYEEAMSTRDPIAVARLMSMNLKVNLKMLDRGTTDKYDYWKFSEMVKLVLNAYPHYKVQHRCKPGKDSTPARAVLDCLTEEEMKMHGKLMWGQANETFHFVVENGEVKIAEMNSVQLTAPKQR